MVKVTVGGELAETFAGVGNEVLVCNEQGTTLGFFRPAISSDPKDYEWARSRMDVEELRRRAADPGPCITTAELMAKLEAIPLPEDK
ncbi:MAG TPA: hypothetical protein VMP01_21985 [Pirellulaceae bacterium]|nr:hypothetical protein [Pirellulaceae bacterium]